MAKKLDNKRVAEISHEYRFGSVEWQDAMLEHIKKKMNSGEPLDAIEKTFLEIKHTHNKQIEKGEARGEGDGRFL